MTRRMFNRLVALWVFCLIVAFMPSEWMFAEWLQWGVTVVYWAIVSFFIGWLILFPFSEWIDDRLEDNE